MAWAAGKGVGVVVNVVSFISRDEHIVSQAADVVVAADGVDETIVAAAAGEFVVACALPPAQFLRRLPRWSSRLRRP